MTTKAYQDLIALRQQIEAFCEEHDVEQIEKLHYLLTAHALDLDWKYLGREEHPEVNDEDED